MQREPGDDTEVIEQEQEQAAAPAPVVTQGDAPQINSWINPQPPAHALKVWSYAVPSLLRANAFTQRMPKGAHILGVERGTQSAVMYALVHANPAAPTEERCFVGVKTNFPLPYPGEELVGVQEDGQRTKLGQCKGLVPVGSVVGWGQTWHLFEVLR